MTKDVNNRSDSTRVLFRRSDINTIWSNLWLPRSAGCRPNRKVGRRHHTAEYPNRDVCMTVNFWHGPYQGKKVQAPTYQKPSLPFSFFQVYL